MKSQQIAKKADADNLSATLSLMVPELANDIPDNCPGDGCNANQCLYMEQLLVRKHEEPKEGQGNVYIDRGNSKMHV
ncbi:Protein of unknown function [Gryllus bimaculatus]|nr:Protein of unknown function [Gryllus bimaculatus]